MHSQFLKQFKSLLNDKYYIDKGTSVISLLHSIKDDDKSNAIILIETSDKSIKKYQIKIAANRKANLIFETYERDDVTHVKLDFIFNPSDYIKISFQISSSNVDSLEENIKILQSTLDKTRFGKTYVHKHTVFSSSACDGDDDDFKTTSYEWMKEQLLKADPQLQKILPDDIAAYALEHKPKPSSCLIL